MAGKLLANQHLSTNKLQNLYAIVNLKLRFDPFLFEVLYLSKCVAFLACFTLFCSVLTLPFRYRVSSIFGRGWIDGYSVSPYECLPPSPPPHYYTSPAFSQYMYGYVLLSVSFTNNSQKSWKYFFKSFAVDFL
jgi:hypothetical protein